MLTCFDTGVSVLEEKPLSDDADAVRELVRADQNAGFRHMVLGSACSRAKAKDPSANDRFGFITGHHIVIVVVGCLAA